MGGEGLQRRDGELRADRQRTRTGIGAKTGYGGCSNYRAGGMVFQGRSLTHGFCGVFGSDKDTCG